MSLDLLHRLSGTDQEFVQGLVELGWYKYEPMLTDCNLMGKARSCLNPQLKAAGEVRGTDAWVYRLYMQHGKWQDAVAIVESYLKREPKFAVVFCTLPGELLILVPSNPDKAFRRAESGLTVDCICLDTRRPSNFETETIKKLREAPDKRFRARLQEMVNTERVTKKFYDRFQKELSNFQELIGGITVDEDRLWYSSVMLNRLMFIYFLQRKGFLDGKRDYLSNRFKAVQERRGKNEFQSFYRCFLLRLFHEGLGSRKREPDFEELLGKIPYLNGGLFEVHDIESRYLDETRRTLIDIPDEAFKSMFSFFDEYEWCLDTRPSRTEREINPEVLGYIFEKYVNQKQMGAYYTKEDITDYISKNTIIPYIFDAAEKRYKAAFEGEDAVWLLLHIEPDRYIYDAVQKGVELELPEDIACGLDDVSKRDKWNTPAPEEYALPTEIWREVIARRKRYEELRGKLERGEIRSIDDLITFNLNIIQFARDIIEITDSPELIRAIWYTMAGRLPEIGANTTPIPPLTVLDPTCGSGAFLFAALNILEPLYEGCLERMQAFVAEADATGDSRKYPDFRSVLARMSDTAKHPSREYFILKSIILNNLYGVDIMEEAVEICKLRLFLKLAAVVEPNETRDNCGLEPLPDIDFNIRAGNTLVGFATEKEVRDATSEGKVKQQAMIEECISGQMELIGDIDKSPAFRGIMDRLDIVDAAYEQFRQQQVELGGDVTAEDKMALRAKLSDLENELNRYLARRYIFASVQNKEKYEQWLETHKPFHWFVEFYGIMKRGGFDVIIGNPPYVEYSKVEKDYRIKGYATLSCGNLYSLIVERIRFLAGSNARTGLIIPMAIVSTQRMGLAIEQYLESSSTLWGSHYAGDSYPGTLFNGVKAQLSILLSARGVKISKMFSTRYRRWFQEERDYILYNQLEYSDIADLYDEDNFIRLGNIIEQSIWCKIRSQIRLSMTLDNNREDFFFRNYSGSYYRLFFDKEPPFIKNGVAVRSSSISTIGLRNPSDKFVILGLLSSTLFYWYHQKTSDAWHVSQKQVADFRFDLSRLSHGDRALIESAAKSFLFELWQNAKWVNYTRRGDTNVYQEFYARRSKRWIDQIDRVLAKHYGFTDEELDFIINYDIKYRMGLSGAAEDKEEEKE